MSDLVGDGHDWESERANWFLDTGYFCAFLELGCMH